MQSADKKACHTFFTDDCHFTQFTFASKSCLDVLKFARSTGRGQSDAHFRYLQGYCMIGREDLNYLLHTLGVKVKLKLVFQINEKCIEIYMNLYANISVMCFLFS